MRKINLHRIRNQIIKAVLGLCILLLIPAKVQAKEQTITLRVCNWEEYLDLGNWSEEEAIELDNGETIFGKRALYEEFEDWYYETYGKRVKVEYSCFGTNEDLYNQLTLGDTYDLVCPSDYMLMKLMAEGKAEPFSDEFFDEDNEYNYYIKGVSPFISQVFEENSIGGEAWREYAACYMWGITGVLYNPEYITKEEAETWTIFENPKFYRQVTLKDNVRDTYFVALACLYRKELTNPAFWEDPDYAQKLDAIMNDVSKETIDEVEHILQGMMGNVYALETDSGKADMVTGKVLANCQWSGDAVYAMDLAEAEDVYLKYAVPKECTNLWFDGWIMLKNGIREDADRKHAAEAFVNFLSRPDNAVRNMYYIGYTSSIAGGDSDTVFSYLNYCYGTEDEEGEDVIAYPVGYFFSGDEEDEAYIVYADPEQEDRQLFSQYPSMDVIRRAAIMGYYDEEQTKNINQMWINIRCFNIKDIPSYAYAIVVGFILIAAFIWIQKAKKKTFYFDKHGLYGIIVIVFIVLSVFLLFNVVTLQQSRDDLAEDVRRLEKELSGAREDMEAISDELSEATSMIEELLQKEEESAIDPEPDVTEEPVTEKKHKVYLTFDDGPSKRTMEILDILDIYNVKATFFVLGKEDEASKELLKEIADRGHSIGMHSYSHEYGEIYSSLDAFIADYHRISDYVYENTGIRSNLYRFPGGSSNRVSDIDIIEAARYLTGCGVTYVDWNVSSGDAEKRSLTVEKLIENCTKGIETRETNVILLHDAVSKDVTIEALPLLIETLQAMEDTELLPITEETKRVQHIQVDK